MSEKLRNELRLLETALERLEHALAQPVNEFVRDSAIQRFEFTFELPSVRTFPGRGDRNAQARSLEGNMVPHCLAHWHYPRRDPCGSHLYPRGAAIDSLRLRGRGIGSASGYFQNLGTLQE